jgi:hypothetical protein
MHPVGGVDPKQGMGCGFQSCISYPTNPHMGWPCLPRLPERLNRVLSEIHAFFNRYCRSAIDWGGTVPWLSRAPHSDNPSGWDSQSGVTIWAEVTPGAESGLITTLQAIGRQVSSSGLPFSRSDLIHYVRFVFIRADVDPLGQHIPASLMYLADFDSDVATHLAELAQIALHEFASLGQYLKHPVPSTSPELVSWLERHVISDATYYVNTIGRTLRQIRNDADLRARLETFLDGQHVSALDPLALRKLIQDHVVNTPALEWAYKPSPSNAAWRLQKAFALFVAGLLVIVTLPVTLPLLLFWALALRCREDFDAEDPTRPADAHITSLAATEDLTLQNQFSALGFVKPGWFRRTNATIILLIGKFATRYLFSHADLAGVKTIHFARWTFIDGKRRMLFSSNYDGSLENYMGDFIDLIWWGLNIIFSNGVGYPHTRWGFFEGAKDEGAFKRHIRNRQIITQVWYAACPNLSAVNIATNARIRAGLFGSQSTKQTQQWLSLL